MSVSREDVLHVAKLARLTLSPEEVERYTAQLNTILAHAAELEAADAEAQPMIGAAEWPAPLRADVPGADVLAFPVTALSPAFEDGFFTVPRLAAMEGGAEP